MAPVSLITNKLYQTSEGRIFFTGIFMLVSLLALIGYYGITDLEKFKTLAFTLLVNTFGGRAAGVGVCIISGLSTTWAIVYNFYIEALAVCFTYSLFVFLNKNYINTPWLITMSNNLVRNANKNKEIIRKYGWVGLFMFVMLPFPVTGPVIGSIIGYLIRIQLWKNFSAVFLGTLSAIALWVYCFEFLDQRLHIIQYILVAIIIIVFFYHFRTIKNWIKK